jgi:regulation of enolase protein 1 (concanavalin A-like superfamily)
MIRESLDPGSRFAAVYITPDYGCRFQARAMTSTAATSDSAVVTPDQTAIKAPYWVKLERTGNEFKGYYSANGTTWTPMVWNPQTIAMTGDVYVGLAVTSHNAAAQTLPSWALPHPAAAAQWQVATIGGRNRATMPGSCT